MSQHLDHVISVFAQKSIVMEAVHVVSIELISVTMDAVLMSMEIVANGKKMEHAHHVISDTSSIPKIVRNAFLPIAYDTQFNIIIIKL